MQDWPREKTLVKFKKLHVHPDFTAQSDIDKLRYPGTAKTLPANIVKFPLEQRLYYSSCYSTSCNSTSTSTNSSGSATVAGTNSLSLLHKQRPASNSSKSENHLRDTTNKDLLLQTACRLTYSH
eukprot:1391538-Rhodomonas_salina.2